ncbi:hypothetical protein C8R45DRAFT_568173 [Mycena sanguinolenta]|nr:hypothetical protein C8R45DRAFT_568173 [Mycena sanguinolenta]
MFVKFSRAVVLGIVCIMLASFTEVQCLLLLRLTYLLQYAWNIHYCKLSDLCLPREWRYALRRDYMCSLASSHH